MLTPCFMASMSRTALGEGNYYVSSQWIIVVVSGSNIWIQVPFMSVT
jgi:hypothetical protein